MSAAELSAAAFHLVVFLLDGHRYGVELGRVERVLRMVELTPFPRAPEIVAGVFEYRGQLVPVMNVRRRFGLPERPATPADQLLLLRTPRRRLAFAVDAVQNAVEVPAGALVPGESVVPGLEHLRGIARLPGEGLVFVQDIDAFLSLEEARQLESALEGARP